MSHIFLSFPTLTADNFPFCLLFSEHTCHRIEWQGIPQCDILLATILIVAMHIDMPHLLSTLLTTVLHSLLWKTDIFKNVLHIAESKYIILTHTEHRRNDSQRSGGQTASIYGGGLRNSYGIFATSFKLKKTWLFHLISRNESGRFVMEAIVEILIKKSQVMKKVRKRKDVGRIQNTEQIWKWRVKSCRARKLQKYYYIDWEELRQVWTQNSSYYIHLNSQRVSTSVVNLNSKSYVLIENFTKSKWNGHILQIKTESKTFWINLLLATLTHSDQPAYLPGRNKV